MNISVRNIYAALAAPNRIFAGTFVGFDVHDSQFCGIPELSLYHPLRDKSMDTIPILLLARHIFRVKQLSQVHEHDYFIIGFPTVTASASRLQGMPAYSNKPATRSPSTYRVPKLPNLEYFSDHCTLACNGGPLNFV
jgi:hypothetical protein